MTQTSNYYQKNPEKNDDYHSGRFPKNHVKFSKLLSILQLIDWAYKLFGSKAFMILKPMLQEFDSAAPYNSYQGTDQEISQLKNFVISYCNGIDNNTHLSSIGRYLIKTMGLGLLKNRKKVLQYYHSNKAFIDSNGKFKSPIIITGTARSGTTLLQRLLSEDPNTRSPYTFELENPLPPMDGQADPLLDSRIKKSSAGIKTLSKLAPGFLEKFAESHLWSPTEMEESLIYIDAHNGINVMNSISAGMAHLTDAIEYEDKRALFRYERLFYTILDAYKPAMSHWTLKAPVYAIYFPLIFEEYDNAKVILTHRNPLVTLPSLCRLWESWCIAFDVNGSFDKHRFGLFIHFLQEKYLMVPFKYRNEHPEYENRIFDCVYEDFFSDPIEMVQKIYKKFDLEYTTDFEKRMMVYLKNNQQGKYGRHKYSLEEYGFNPEQLYTEYKEYMDYYGFKIQKKMLRPTSFDFLKNRKQD